MERVITHLNCCSEVNSIYLRRAHGPAISNALGLSVAMGDNTMIDPLDKGVL